MTASIISMNDFDKSKAQASEVNGIDAELYEYFGEVEDRIFDLCNTLMAIRTKEEILALCKTLLEEVGFDVENMGSYAFLSELPEEEFAYMMEK